MMDNESNTKWKLYRDFVSGHFGSVEFIHDANYFDYQLNLPVQVPNIIGTIDSTPHLVRRTQATVRQDPADFVRVVVPRAGEVLLEQGDKRTSLQPGQFAIYDASRPVTIGARTNYSNTIVSLPRSLVSTSVPNLMNLSGVKLDRNSPTNRVFFSLIFELERVGPELGSQELKSFIPGVASALGVVLATATNQLDNSTILLTHLMKKIEDRIRDPDLRLEDVAAAEGISTRSIGRAFQQVGKTPWGWVVEKRLQGVAYDLRATSNASRSLTDIAMSWGFNNMSHFSRAFKNRFGQTPSEWRFQI